jgi:hypothetical protein
MTDERVRRKGTFQPKWNYQPTTKIRIPEQFLDTIMGLSKLLDADVISIEQLEEFAEKKMNTHKLLRQVQVQEDNQQQPEPEKSKVTEIKSKTRERKTRKFTFE